MGFRSFLYAPPPPTAPSWKGKRVVQMVCALEPPVADDVPLEDQREPLEFLGEEQGHREFLEAGDLPGDNQVLKQKLHEEVDLFGEDEEGESSAAAADDGNKYIAQHNTDRVMHFRCTAGLTFSKEENKKENSLDDDLLADKDQLRNKKKKKRRSGDHQEVVLDDEDPESGNMLIEVDDDDVEMEDAEHQDVEFILEEVSDEDEKQKKKPKVNTTTTTTTASSSTKKPAPATSSARFTPFGWSSSSTGASPPLTPGAFGGFGNRPGPLLNFQSAAGGAAGGTFAGFAPNVNSTFNLIGGSTATSSSTSLRDQVAAINNKRKAAAEKQAEEDKSDIVAPSNDFDGHFHLPFRLDKPVTELWLMNQYKQWWKDKHKLNVHISTGPEFAPFVGYVYNCNRKTIDQLDKHPLIFPRTDKLADIAQEAWDASRSYERVLHFHLVVLLFHLSCCIPFSSCCA